MIEIEQSGDFTKTENWLSKLMRIDPSKEVSIMGSELVNDLASNTPYDTGLTQASWEKTVEVGPGSSELIISNSSEGSYNVIQGIRFGHGTGTGGYAPANDFVTPILKNKLDKTANTIVKKVIE